MSIRIYPAYMDIQAEWLGEVPIHWEVKRLKYALRLKTDKTDRRTNPVALENIEGWSGRYIESDTEYSGDGVAFEAEDILFGKLRPYLAKVLKADTSGEAVGDFHVLSPDVCIHGRYAQYQMLNRGFISVVDGATYGAKMPRVGWDFMANLPFIVPPLPEQRDIASFLDRETAKIDALIEEQRRLIDLVKEKRQAVIAHTVTKGLNPDVKMKESGIEWLGELPEHWKVVPLRRIAARVQTGRTPTTETPLEEAHGLPWFTPGDFGDDLILTSAAKSISRDCIDRNDANLFSAGAVLIVSIGATLGRVGFFEGPSSGNQQINAVTPSDAVLGRYLAYSLAAKSALMRFLSNASTIGIMNQEKTKEIVLVLPPVSEQAEIICYLDETTKRLDELTSIAEEAIGLLQERRSALISAAVTGKIDVRGFIETQEAAE